MATSHPQIDEDGTVWNIGTAHHKKSGFVYTIFKFEPKSEDQGKIKFIYSIFIKYEVLHLLCILTNEHVLGMLFACQNNIFQHFNVFLHHNLKKNKQDLFETGILTGACGFINSSLKQ